ATALCALLHRLVSTPVADLLSDISSLVIFFLLRRRPPRSTLFPYTTLFRSAAHRFHGSLEHRPLILGELDLNNLLDAARAQDDGHADVDVLLAVLDRKSVV